MKNSRIFPGPQKHLSRTLSSATMFKYRNVQQLGRLGSTVSFLSGIRSIPENIPSGSNYGYFVCRNISIRSQNLPSRSLPNKFQDSPGPTLFSRTFQLLEILQQKFKNCPGFFRRRRNPDKK